MSSIKEFDHLKISLDAIMSATNNFNEKNYINKGEFGEVYKGELWHHEKLVMVAVKRLDRIYRQGTPEFWKEIWTLSQYKHENLVSLLGFCNEGGESILVYEYLSNNSLDIYLNNANLSWLQRLNICIGAARGLEYLHNCSGTKQTVLHCDINSSNVLLDDKWNAKISDFGFSILEKHYLKSTLGYMDRLYLKSGVFTKESNVYSFGVVLFEALCGKKDSGRLLSKLAYEQKKIHTIVPDFLREQIVPKCLHTYTKIAYQCLQENLERPSAAYIVKQLENALKYQMGLQIRLEEILSATNHFSDENLIKEGELGKVYRGILSDECGKFMIAARRLNRKYGQGDVMFRTEIFMLSSLNHKNIISIVGYVDENDEKILIYDLPFNGILDQHISDPTLSWSQRLQICLGVAKALNHIHYDVIHCDINSCKIFLDKDWEPKIFGFEFSTKYPESWRHRLLYSRYFHSTSMTPKFDVYCFGELMYEILCGRKPMTIEDVVKEKVYDDIVHPNLLKQIGEQSLNCFLKTATNCLKQEPVERPTMDQIVNELKETLEFQKIHENLEQSAAARENATTRRLKMDILRIPLREIERATDNFHNECIGEGGYGKVYQAQLDVLDIHDMSSIQGKSKDELPKINKTVAIKRIHERRDEQDKEGFLTEIVLLTSCKHPNIVSLLGFSEENREMILVYEYVSKGSLSDYFENRPTNLTWVQRIQISLDIAKGINYLHTEMEGKPRILHRDIKSQNILLDENLKAKVADFGLSRFHPKEQQASTIYTKHIAGTEVYMDPEYLHTGKYKKESDIYSFGIVLFEILSGRMAYDNIYMMENDVGLGPIARRRFNEGTLKELIDPKMIDDDKHVFTINRGPNQQSFDAFSKIAYHCLAETQAKRPTIEDIIDKLEDALKLQGETIVLYRFQLSDITSATENFSESYCIGLYSYGTLYKAELDHFDNKGSLVAVKCFYGKGNGQEEEWFFSEIEMRTNYNHPNIVSLLGFCDEQDEMILLYEHAANKSLDDYLKSVDKLDNLTWTQRLHMCLDIAHGLNHIHTKMDPQQHGDLRSANVQLGNNWQAKIAYFGISNLLPSNQEVVLQVYWDPVYEKAGKLEKESDIYSFGVVMFEIFCGKLAYDQVYIDECEKGLAPIARRCFKDGTIEKMIDPKLMEEIDEDNSTLNRRPNQRSLDTFLRIAYKCLGRTQASRPTLEIVIKELEKALNFQVKKKGKWRKREW